MGKKKHHKEEEEEDGKERTISLIVKEKECKKETNLSYTNESK